MNVKDLMKKLQELPPEKQILVYCGNDPHEIKSVVFDDVTIWLDTDNYDQD